MKREPDASAVVWINREVSGLRDPRRRQWQGSFYARIMATELVLIYSERGPVKAAYRINVYLKAKS